MAVSNSRVIPREELSEFQRWQFSTLLDEIPKPQVAAKTEAVVQPETQPVHQPVESQLPAPVVESSHPLDMVHFPTAEEIEAIERQAQEEGYQSGLAAGRLAAELEVNQLRALLTGVSDACRGVEVQLAEDVLDLALVVARQLVREELQVDRAFLLPAIREAIAGLPTVREPARLVLNPEDLTTISALLGSELPSDYWRFIPDSSLPVGSCRIESSVTSIDLTLATRWDNLLRVLGRNKRADLSWAAAPLPVDSDHARSD
ncbi:MAG: hypothetical protein H6R07_2267 [Proteobacteria bacterium]|nr:hypothetical protein [Pseudomonadota bacterium]